MLRNLMRTGLIMGMTVMTVGVATSQQDPRRESGPLQSPKPYGDRGTQGVIGNPPIAYPTRPPAGADPVQYWKNRIITPRHGGGTVIIINGSPCYTPWYYNPGYGYGYPGAYNDSYFYGNVQLGGVNLGYAQRQTQSYNSYGTIAPVYPQVRRPVDTRAQEYYDDTRDTRRPPAASSEEPSYYLHQKPRPKTLVEKDPTLSQAVADIERAFRNGDLRPLESHIVARENLALSSKGHSRKSITGETYLELTRDALANLKTTKFELPNAEPASNGAVMVYGTHVIRAEDGKSVAFSVSFVLKKRGEQWFITEVSADPAK